MAKKVKKKAAAKSAGKKQRSLNAPGAGRSTGEPTTNQDAKRRLGNFSGAGEHARQGGRTSGIVGQTKRQNKTDKKS
jgi:hypothetical protein